MGILKFTSNTSNSGMEDEIISLYRSINSFLSDKQKKVIQFIGSREEEGTSTIVREFAIISVEKFRNSVLLLDADIQKPSQHIFFNVMPEYSIEDVIKDGRPVDNAICQVGDTHLFVSTISKCPSSTPQIFDYLRNDNFLSKMNQFDLILVDSPPATTSSDGLAISHLVDGIVLVLEAEKTRWPIAESIKDKIIKNGGNILGIAFNKRRHYIPELLYKRL
jgi:Mrp family chromosome partitioning ATPase